MAARKGGTEEKRGGGSKGMSHAYDSTSFNKESKAVPRRRSKPRSPAPSKHSTPGALGELLHTP